MKKPHIVIFRTGGSYVNYATYNSQEVGLAKALAKKGYTVSVVMGGSKASHNTINQASSKVDIYYLTYRAIHQSLCVFDGWTSLLAKLNPDVVQVHDMGILMSWLVAKWAKRRGIRCVLVQGNYETTHKPVFKQLETLFNLTLGKSLLKTVDATGCKTQAAKEYIRHYVPTITNAILTPVGLDEDRFAHTPGDADDDIRLKYRLNGKKILLYVGQLEPRRHPMLLLQVMQLLPADYSLLIVGDGVMASSVKDYIAANKMTNVTMMGKMRQDQLPTIYHAADLFLLPSSYEIFGMVILEAMYFGVPVISSSTAGANTIIDKDTGIILPTFDVKVWKESIMEICNNSEKLQAMKQRCAATIRDKYVWDKAAANFEKLYF